MAASYLTYGGALTLGFLHGSDPGHGWLLAVLYSLSSPGRGLSSSLAYVSVLAVGHMVSSLVVVLGVWALGVALVEWVSVMSVAASALLVLVGAWGAFRALRERGEAPPAPPGLREAVKYSLLLGFAHEEEVALAAIVLAGTNPLALGLAYSASVYASMAVWTAASRALVARLDRVRSLLESWAGLASSAAMMLIGAALLYESAARL